MRATEILRPEPSLFAWSRTARPVRLAVPSRSRASAASSSPQPGGVDDALFASASVALVATFLVAIVAA